MSKIQLKTCKKRHICKDFSYLTKKNSAQNLTSFDTLVDPEATKVRMKSYGGRLSQCALGSENAQDQLTFS